MTPRLHVMHESFSLDARHGRTSLSEEGDDGEHRKMASLIAATEITSSGFRHKWRDLSYSESLVAAISYVGERDHFFF